MICDECGKRPANFHLTKMANGNKTEYHLCEPCAKSRGDWGFSIQPDFSIHQLLSSLLNYPADQAERPESRIEAAIPTCRECGMNYQDFAKTGRLGCGRCYEEFGGHLEQLLRRVHGASDHSGKVPARAAEAIKAHREIDRVKAEMAKAIEREDFEAAAKLRDKIRELEKDPAKTGQGKGGQGGAD